MSNGDLNWIANYIWGIADDVLRDLYVRGKYRDVILPITVLRRLDAVLEGSKQAVLDMKATLDDAGVVEQEAALRQAAGQAFYNTSRFTLSDLRARGNRQQLTADFQAYLDGFSPNVQDILDNFEFRNQIPRLSRADALGTLIEKLTSPNINLSPAPVGNADGSVKHPGLDNHGMGTIFEELVRRFNEENNEEAGEHWTPRDAVRLMAKLVFQPIADQITSGTYLLYDGACGTGGMLTVAEETLQELAAEHGKEVATHLYGQEINAETFAICKADLLLKGEGEAADNIVGGPEHSTLSNDGRHPLAPPAGTARWHRPLRKNLGKKNCELGEEDIARICDTFLAFEETEHSKILDNDAFGYWKVTVERPLRIKGADPNRAYKAAEVKKLNESGERSETAPPVIRKIHKRGTDADPLRGRFAATIDGRPAVVEYEADTDLRDTEQIPLQEAGGIEAFLRREVLPYAADAWYRPDSVRTGYEISFTRHFYQPLPMRTLGEIRADILVLEKETEGLLDQILEETAPLANLEAPHLRRHLCHWRLRGRGVPRTFAPADPEIHSRRADARALAAGGGGTSSFAPVRPRGSPRRTRCIY